MMYFQAYNDSGFTGHTCFQTDNLLEEKLKQNQKGIKKEKQDVRDKESGNKPKILMERNSESSAYQLEFFQLPIVESPNSTGLNSKKKIIISKIRTF